MRFKQKFNLDLINMLSFGSLNSLSVYRNAQEEYKAKEWYKEPVSKLRSRGRVRADKRQVQSFVSQERRHVDVRFN